MREASASPRTSARLRSHWRWAGACASLAVVLGCGKTPAAKAPECDVQTIGVTVIALPEINPTTFGAPRPVQMRLYQLADDMKLQNAEFTDIWKDDKKTLGEDLIKVDEFPVYPDTRSELQFERDGAANFVAGVALFRAPKGRSWFVSFELPPPPGEIPCDPPECEGDSCPGPGRLHFYFRIDGTRIDDGADSADFVPRGGKVRILHVTPSASSPSPEAEEAP